MIIEKIHVCSKMNFSSNINEVIRAILNALFFYKKILHAPKARKAPKSTKTQISEQKLKNALKKHLRGEKSLFRLFAFLCFFVSEEKRIEKRKLKKEKNPHKVMYRAH